MPSGDCTPTTRLTDVKVTRTYDSRLDVSTEVLRELTEIPRIRELLRSAFDDTASWLDGDLGPEAIHEPPIGALEEKLDEILNQVSGELSLRDVRRRSGRLHQASVLVHDRALVRPGAAPPDCRQQFFTLMLRSQIDGDETLIRCTSPVGRLNLRDTGVLDDLYELQRELGGVRVCAGHDPRGHQYHVSVEEERLFHLSVTQGSEIRQLIERTVVAADVIEQKLLAVDAPVSAAMEVTA